LIAGGGLDVKAAWRGTLSASHAGSIFGRDGGACRRRGQPKNRRRITMTQGPPVRIDVVSDVVCPWCYIGKRRLENALDQLDDVAVSVRWRPFFLNPWIPREGVDRETYLVKKFGSAARYDRIAEQVYEAAAAEGLQYNAARINRQPNTIDCHRLIHWAKSIDRAGVMKQRLMDLYFRDGADLTDNEVLIAAAAECGLEADRVRTLLAGDVDVELVTHEAQAAAEAGINGVPTFILANKYGVSGAQAADQLADAIRQVAAMTASESAAG
jgi:predicted DsbA family dithiol-disulfide isomerase